MSNHNTADLEKTIEKIDVHDHLCLVYESRDEQLAVVIPFMRIGLERGEQCVYIADDNTVDTLLEAMLAGGIDTEAAIGSGALSVITKRDSYLKEGSFDPERMIEFLKDATTAAKANGYGALRVAGEMTWMLAGEPGAERLMEYETKLNYFFPEFDCLALCQYNRQRFDPELIRDVIQTQPLVIFGATVCRNYYYIPPDEFLQAKETRAAVEVDRMLAGLVGREQAEADAHKREEQLTYFYKQSPIAIEYYDADGLLVDVNQACLDMFGVDSVFEIKGFNLFDDPNLMVEAKMKLRDGELVQFESVFDFDLVRKKSLYRTSKKGRIFIHCHLTPLKTEAGSINGYLVHVQDVTERVEAEKALQARERQHAAVAELGQQALEGEDLSLLMQKATALAARAINVEFCKVLELSAGADLFLLRAGVGWKEGLVGHATVHTGAESQAGYTLLSDKPVIVEDFATEARFSAPPLLQDHGIASGISVIIPNGDQPFGVLGIHSNRRRVFTKDDVNFAQVIANVLAMAIERKRAEEELRKSESLLHTVLSNVPMTIFATDSQGVFTLSEGKGLETVGLKPGENVGVSAHELYDVLPFIKEDGEEIFGKEVIDRALAGRTMTVFSELEGVIFENHIGPFQDEGGDTIGIIGVAIDVTERTRAEEAYRTLVDNSLQGLAIFQNGCLVFANQALADITGYSVEELLTRSTDQLVANAYPEERERMTELMQRIYGGKPFNPRQEVRFLKKDGVEIWAETLMKLTDYKGKPAIQAVYLDITKRKKSEQELVEAHRLLETIFDHTHMMGALLDTRLNFIRVNRAYAIADEKEPSFFPGKNHFDLYPNKENEEIFKRVVETGEPYYAIARPFQYEQHPERGVSYWDWSLVPIKDEDGAVASLIFTLLNVTERVQSVEAIIRSEEKYRTLFEESKDGIVTISPEGSIEDINPAGVEMLGYSSAEEMLRLGTMIDLYLRKEDRDRFISTLTRQEFVKNYEMDLKRKDGEPLVVSITVSASKDEHGKILSFRGIMRDMTAHRLLEQQLIEAQKMETVGRLAGGVAHDFNNFLTAIQGYIDLARMEAAEGSEASEDLMEARASSERAANLARQLLLFSRREPVEMKPVNLNKGINDLLKMLGRLIGEQYSIKTELADDLWVVNADSGHLEQVIMNLVVNARDAMPEGGEIVIRTKNIRVDPGYVKTRTAKSKIRFVELSVTDAGIGMDEETLKHIFEPFFSTKGAASGTGLGLSVVYGIVAQHGGWIDVDSVPGKGSTFRIFLPAMARTAAAGQVVEATEGLIHGHGERILLVEDEAAVRKMAERILVDNGYEVVSAANAESALEAFGREGGRFDLVFSDVVLSGKDGVWLVEQLRSSSPDLPVLLASGYSDTPALGTIGERGYMMLRKPYALPELLRCISGLIKR